MAKVLDVITFRSREYEVIESELWGRAACEKCALCECACWQVCMDYAMFHSCDANYIYLKEKESNEE